MTFVATKRALAAAIVLAAALAPASSASADPGRPITARGTSPS